MVSDTRIASLESGSGISWPQWLEFLEPHQDLDHTEMARVVLDRILTHGDSSSPEWWAQGVTVAYEQHIGRRGVGQRCDGSFSVSVSKTVPCEMDEALRAVQACEKHEYAGVPVDGEPRTSSTEKWRYWRATLADGSKVTINIQHKGDAKSVLAVNHDQRNTDADVAEVKAWWKAFLGEVATHI